MNRLPQGSQPPWDPYFSQILTNTWEAAKAPSTLTFYGLALEFNLDLIHLFCWRGEPDRHETKLAAVVQRPKNPEHLQPGGHRIPSIAAGRRMWIPARSGVALCAAAVALWGGAVAFWICITPRLKPLCCADQGVCGISGVILGLYLAVILSAGGCRVSSFFFLLTRPRQE